MEINEIKTLLEAALDVDLVKVSGEGSHYNVIVVGDMFDGMSRIKKQQAVYNPLSEQIASGAIHALSIKAFTPEQWKRESLFN